MLTPPSPSSSPVNDTSSRKRQRSPSMHSEADSSSPKRAASQDLVLENSSSPREHPAKADYNADEDIDTYMAEQGEANIPLTLDLSTPPPPPVTNLTPMTKLESIDSLRKKPMQPGEMWYLVARPWYKRWRLACSGEEDKEGRVNEADLGPVDNSSLVDASGNLISSATEGVDVEFVPEQAWNLLVQWYGEPPYTLQRKVITRGMFNEASLELYPPRFKIHLLSPQPIDNDLEESIPLTMSSKDTLSDLHKHILLAVPKSDGGERRVWRLTEGGNWTRLHYPATRLKEDGASLLEDNRKYLEEGMIESGDTFVVEEAGPDGKWLIDGLPRSTAVSGTTTPLSTADSSTRLFGTSDFFSNLQAKATIAGNETKVEKKALTLKPPVTIKVGPSSNIRSKGPKIIPGTLGLGNMGNTCFMNSAIQCLAHTEELTEFFLTGVFEDELNPENPLGMHGAIAEAFGALLRRIWDTNSSMSSYSPREFKSVLQRFAPQFAGYQQHDSQELVAFLLDGLHEDLNRILKKPYVEKPDWEGGGDKEMVALAKESWDGYMKRNDSVIVDLFQGQYKSTLVCPECQKVSITFDPFMYLTLPLPVQKKFTHDIYYVPWDHSKSHVKVPIEMSRDSSFRDVRQQLARWMNSDADLLLTLEIFNHRFFKDLDDHVSWGDVQDNDIIVCFELPCHARQSRNYKKQEGDPFILPVFMCDTIQSISRTSSYNNTISYFGYPFFVVLDEKQATDPDAMYDAIIERLERWSANVRDLYKWEAGPSDASMEEVPIPITSAPAPTTETVTEIKVNGDVVNVEEPIPEEGDIVDEKSIVIQEDASMSDTEPDDSEIPRRVGTKKGIYNLRLHGPVYGGSNYGGLYNISSRGLVDWEMRKNRARADEKPILLRHGDSLFIEFDVNMKSYYFGDDRSAKWSHWEEFIHPDLAASRKSAEARKDKKITLQDCLDEFTREETLGQDDLWYCPRCKKHQQATKRFDLWKTPDVLVVHLKRFSNSRLLRDKIDAFVDFPVQGLDLTDMIGEREVAKRLLSENVNVEELGLTDLDEPLLYDLYAVDEHLGGLGGGHYRAYAHNHLNDKWYHFDDSYVSEANADKAVSSNAYLLFYKRRTSRPLGGKSHLKIEEARNKPKPSTPTPEVKIEDSQLPTPPAESPPNSYTDAEPDIDATDSSFMTPYSDGISSPGSSPPPLDDSEPPSFEAAQFDPVLQTNLDESLDPLLLYDKKFDFPDPTIAAPGSPSSTGAEPDMEEPQNPDDIGTITPNSSTSDPLRADFGNERERALAHRRLSEIGASSLPSGPQTHLREYLSEQGFTDAYLKNIGSSVAPYEQDGHVNEALSHYTATEDNEMDLDNIVDPEILRSQQAALESYARLKDDEPAFADDAVDTLIPGSLSLEEEAAAIIDADPDLADIGERLLKHGNDPRKVIEERLVAKGFSRADIRMLMDQDDFGSEPPTDLASEPEGDAEEYADTATILEHLRKVGDPQKMMEDMLVAKGYTRETVRTIMAKGPVTESYAALMAGGGPGII